MRAFAWFVFVVVVAVFGAAQVARAEGTVAATTGPGTAWQNNIDGAGLVYSSDMDACNAGIAFINAHGGHYNGNNDGYETVSFAWFCAWQGDKWGDTGGINVTSGQGVVTTCPANSAQSGGSCACASGYVPSGSSCAPAATACPGVASGMSGTYYSTVSGASGNLCNANCVISSGISGTDSSGTYFGAPFGSTGQACSGSVSQPASTSGLIPGYCPGTVNGVAVPGGVPCTSTTSGSTSTTTPGTTSTASAPAGASNGTSTSSSTTCTGGSCTTTTTTTNTSGVGSPGGGTSTTGSSTTTQSQSAFCQANPSDPQCSQQSSFGGSCQTDFSCKGDAVQCAQAKIEYESVCVFNASPSTATAAKYSALSSQAGHDVAGAFSDSVSLSSALPAPPTAGAGVADMSVSFGSGITQTTLSVPIGTYVTPYLGVIHGVVVAFGYVMFVLIVFVRK